jgi:hypothetical protein
MQEQGGKQVKPETNPKIASTGNASNPSPETELIENESRLIDKKGEKYLRESGNIEDMPDAEDEAEAEQDRAS